MERIIIKNFSGITSLDVEVKRFNIIIGEQATGKSVLTKLLYYFKSLLGKICDSVENEEDKRTLDRGFLNDFAIYFPEVTWGKSSFFVEYRIGETFIRVTKKANKKHTLEYSKYYASHLRRLRTHYNKLVNDAKNAPIDDDVRRLKTTDRWENIRRLRRFHNKICRFDLGENASAHQLFIPAGRSFFANLENNIFSFLSSNNQLDPFLTNFGSYYESIKDIRHRPFPTRLRKDERYSKIKEITDDYTRRIIRGNYKREKRKDFIITTDSRRIPLATSSSGQQETLPLLLILGYLAERSHAITRETVYIEEPEAHLFPRAQKDITEFIALVHTLNAGVQTFITTHSPYILTCLNNIIQRFELTGGDSPYIPSITSNDVSAYALSKSGAVDLVDSETGLIDAHLIDEVSEELAEEFESLL